MSSRYVIAIKRKSRDIAPSGLLESIVQKDGVELVGALSERRVQVDAESDAISSIQLDVGDFIHIEPIIRHKLLKKPIKKDTPENKSAKKKKKPQTGKHNSTRK